MERDKSNNTYKGTRLPDNYLIHSLSGNTSGNNTADSIMNIITSQPNPSIGQGNTEEGE